MVSLDDAIEKSNDEELKQIPIEIFEDDIGEFAETEDGIIEFEPDSEIDESEYFPNEEDMHDAAKEFVGDDSYNDIVEELPEKVYPQRNNVESLQSREQQLTHLLEQQEAGVFQMDDEMIGELEAERSEISEALEKHSESGQDPLYLAEKERRNKYLSSAAQEVFVESGDKDIEKMNEEELMNDVLDTERQRKIEGKIARGEVLSDFDPVAEQKKREEVAASMKFEAFQEMMGDNAEGFVRLFYGGILNAIDLIGRTTHDLAYSAQELLNENFELGSDFIPERKNAELLGNNLLGGPKNMGESIAQGLVTYGIPYAAVATAVSIPSAAVRIPAIGLPVNYVLSDPDSKRLSNVIEDADLPILSDLASYLAHDPNDSRQLSRLKESIQNTILDGVGEGVVHFGLKGIGRMFEDSVKMKHGLNTVLRKKKLVENDLAANQKAEKTSAGTPEGGPAVEKPKSQPKPIKQKAKELDEATVEALESEHKQNIRKSFLEKERTIDDKLSDAEFQKIEKDIAKNLEDIRKFPEDKVKKLMEKNLKKMLGDKVDLIEDAQELSLGKQKELVEQTLKDLSSKNNSSKAVIAGTTVLADFEAENSADKETNALVEKMMIASKTSKKSADAILEKNGIKNLEDFKKLSPTKRNEVINRVIDELKSSSSGGAI